MEAQKIGADQVIKALQSENQEIPAGSIVTPSQEKIVQLRARLAGPQDFRSLIVARRGGKAVTVVRGLALDADGLTKLGKELKAACGTGGTVKDGVVEVQGDHVEKVLAWLLARGHGAKPSGG